jgi:hypothetical protein
MVPTAQPPIQTSIATIFSGGLISFDHISRPTPGARKPARAPRPRSADQH